jgi:hypothetical protein
MRRAALGLLVVAGLANSGCVVLVGSLAAGAAAGTASAAHESQQGTHPTMTYVSSVLASTIYFPVKVAFALAGGVTSGVTYAVTLGKPEPAGSIWRASIEGDYVVSPDVIDGQRAVRFVGDASVQAPETARSNRRG